MECDLSVTAGSRRKAGGRKGRPYETKEDRGSPVVPTHRRGGVQPRPRQRTVDDDGRRAAVKAAPTKPRVTAGLRSCPSRRRGGVQPRPRQRTVDDDGRRAGARPAPTKPG